MPEIFPSPDFSRRPVVPPAAAELGSPPPDYALERPPLQPAPDNDFTAPETRGRKKEVPSAADIHAAGALSVSNAGGDPEGAATTPPESDKVTPGPKPAPQTPNTTPEAPESEPSEPATAIVGPQQPDARTRSETHPYLPAEEVPTGEIKDYYDSFRTPDNVRRASYKIEHGLSPQGQRSDLDEAAKLAASACNQNRPRRSTEDNPAKFVPGAKPDVWYGGAIILANIPAFKDRRELGEVRPETAGSVYKNITHNVLPHTVDEGRFAEAVVCALGARAAWLDDPNQFLYLSGIREGTNHAHNDQGQVYNHDLHQLTAEGSKVPVEVKLHSGTTKGASNYAGRIVVFNFMNELAPAVLGADYLRMTRAERRQLVPVFTDTMRRLMRDEIRDIARQGPTARNPRLDAATRALVDKIARDRAEKGVDSRFNSPRLQAKRRRT